MEARFGERGRGAVFGAPAPHDHGVGRGRLTCRLGSARLPRGLHALGVAAVEAGSRVVVGQGSGSAPSRLPFLCFDWLSGAAEPPPRSFIRSERGRRKSALLHLFFSLASSLLSPFVMEKGNPGSSLVA